MRWEEREARKRAVAEAYRAGGKVGDVCAAHGCSKVFLYAALKELGVPRRLLLPKLLATGAIAGPGGAAAPPGPPAMPGAADPFGATLSVRMERILADRIADLERRVASGRAGDPEAVARALSLNVRTLATLRRVETGSGDGHDKGETQAGEAPGRSLSELRDELRERLHRLRDEGRARLRRRRLGTHGSRVRKGDGPLAPERDDPRGPASA